MAAWWIMVCCLAIVGLNTALPPPRPLLHEDMVEKYDRDSLPQEGKDAFDKYWKEYTDKPKTMKHSKSQILSEKSAQYKFEERMNAILEELKTSTITENIMQLDENASGNTMQLDKTLPSETDDDLVSEEKI